MGGDIKERLLGDGIYPQGFKENTVILSSSNLCIITTRFPLDFINGTHAHEGYEFFMPFKTMPYGKVEKKIYHYEENKVFPINSHQLHGIEKPMLNIPMVTIMVEKNYLDELAYTICGKKEVVFKNESCGVNNSFNVLVQNFFDESNCKNLGYEFILESLSNQLIIEMLRTTKHNLATGFAKSIKTDNKEIKKAIDFINSKQDFDFSLVDIAKEVNFSPYHFIRLFKLHTGQTPYDYIIELKINKAKNLLLNKNLSVTQICFMSGFKSNTHFATIFKKKVGVSPNQYRKMV